MLGNDDSGTGFTAASALFGDSAWAIAGLTAAISAPIAAAAITFLLRVVRTLLSLQLVLLVLRAVPNQTW
jgi:hypothetical protein